MSSAGDGRMGVTTWGQYTDTDGVTWQRWSVRTAGHRAGYLELPLDVGSVEALIIAARAFDTRQEQTA